MTGDYHDALDPWLYVDASAAIGVAQRTGLGKIRHLDTGSLWLQQAVKSGKVGVLKVVSQQIATKGAAGTRVYLLGAVLPVAQVRQMAQR